MIHFFLRLRVVFFPYRISYLASGFFFCFSSVILPQKYATGTLLDSVLYANAPLHAPLMRGDYVNLPKAKSLKQYCPTPAHQGMMGTCAGWSSAYACRTIIDAISNNWDQATIDQNAYSPSFVYNQVRKNKECQDGISLVDALDFLKEKGGLTLKEFEYKCDNIPNKAQLEKAATRRLIEYRMVAARNVKDKSTYVKKSLAENKPVLVGMDCTDSFFKSGELFTPDTSEYVFYGRGHGVAIIGYDDTKYGGAFQIMNSWGTEWGKGGFAWIKYTDFDFFCFYAFEVIGKPDNDATTPNLSGKIIFREPNLNIMAAEFTGKYFEMEKSYPIGTFFELRFSNDQPAYVYVFSWDKTNKPYKIFPFNERMVAYLPYAKNNIAIPDEDSYNLLDNVIGSTYFCFLYSLQKLDIDSILKSVETEKGDFYDRIQKIVGDIVVDIKDSKFSTEDNIKFSAFSKGKKVIPIIIKINQI